MAKKKKINPAEDNHWQDEMSKIFNSEPEIENITCELLLLNNGVYNIYSALYYVKRIDWVNTYDAMINKLYTELTLYEDAVRHTNMVLYLFFTSSYYDYAIDIFNSIKNTKLRYLIKTDDNGKHMLLGGDWTSYIDLINSSDTDANPIISAICEQIYKYFPSVVVSKISVENKFDMDRFSDIDITEIAKDYSDITQYTFNGIIVRSTDKATKFIESIKEYCTNPGIFTYADLLEFLTISFGINQIPYADVQYFTDNRAFTTKNSYNTPENAFTISPDPMRKYKLKIGQNQVLMSMQDIAKTTISLIKQLLDINNLTYSNIPKITTTMTRYLCPMGSMYDDVFVTITFKDLIKLISMSEYVYPQYTFIKDLSLSLKDYFKTYIWPIESDDDFEAYISAILPSPSGQFTNTIDQKENQQTIDLMENEVAEVISQEELERLYIQTIEMDDMEQDEKEGSDQ